MPFATAEQFFTLFFLQLAIVDSRGTPSHNVVGASNMTTNWQKLIPPAPIGPNVGLVQFNTYTDSFKGPGVFTPDADSRQPVIRLVMNVWSVLDTPESEERYIGPLGQIHRDNERYGSPEFWRDEFPSTGSGSVSGIDTDQVALLSQENIGGRLMHWTISIALLAGFV